MRESIALIRGAGAEPAAVAIALDRQERATEDGRDADYSAVQYVTRRLGLQAVAVATLEDLLQYLRTTRDTTLAAHAQAVAAYRARYGVAG